MAARARTTPVNDSAVPNTMPSATPLRSSRLKATPSVTSSNSIPGNTTARRNGGSRSPLAAPTRWAISFSALTISSVAPEMKTKTDVMSAAPRGGRQRPGHQVRVRGPRAVGGAHRLGHQPVVGGEVADRVGPGGVAGERERLAPAAAEVELAAVAAAARLRHPVGAAEAPEQRRLVPDPGQGVLAHAGPGQRQVLRRRARRGLPGP